MDRRVMLQMEFVAEQSVRNAVAPKAPTRRLTLEPLEDRIAPVIMANTEGDFHFRSGIGARFGDHIIRVDTSNMLESQT